MSSRYIVLLAAAAGLMFPGTALAGHAKPGLWSTTATTTVPGMDSQTHTATFCMTPEQANAAGPPGTPGCTMSNARTEGQTYSANMVCTGQFNATGNVSATYDSDTHYTATTNLTTNGVSMTTRSESRWVKADCAGAEH